METRPHSYVHSGFVMKHLVNPVIVWMGGPTLTVVGRRTGRLISTPVPPFVYEGSRYFVSGRGETQWVRNLRAAGGGEMSRGRTRETFRAVELRGDERDRIVAAYRDRLGWRAREFFEALPNLADHAVFRVQPLKSPSTKTS